jgi:uncharacterized membrane protein (DUF373 family)
VREHLSERNTKKLLCLIKETVRLYGVTHEPNNEPKLLDILSILQRAVYYGVATALMVSIGILFVSTAAGLLQVLELGPLETALTVLDRVLLISIFVELLTTVQVLVREREIVAEPFLLIALIAVVRRILLATAELEQSIGTETFHSRLVELGVLGALVVILMVAIYFARRTRQMAQSTESF